MALHLVPRGNPGRSYPKFASSDAAAFVHVGQIPVAMSDDERERAITGCGEQLLAWMAEWERTGCFSHRGVADFWRRQMEELVRGRSPEKVASLEVKRGIHA